MPTVFTNIGKIYQTRPSQQPILTGSKLAEVPSEANAFLRVSDQGKILEVGSMALSSPALWIHTRIWCLPRAGKRSL